MDLSCAMIYIYVQISVFNNGNFKKMSQELSNFKHWRGIIKDFIKHGS